MKLSKEKSEEYRKKNSLIGEFLGAKSVRIGVDVNIYIGDDKMLKMGCWTAHQAWQEYTNPNVINFNNSFEKLLPAFFKIVEDRGKDHYVSKELIEMLLVKDVEKFYAIIINYIESDNNNFSW